MIALLMTLYTSFSSHFVARITLNNFLHEYPVFICETKIKQFADLKYCAHFTANVYRQNPTVRYYLIRKLSNQVGQILAQNLLVATR